MPGRRPSTNFTKSVAGPAAMISSVAMQLPSTPTSPRSHATGGLRRAAGKAPERIVRPGHATPARIDAKDFEMLLAEGYSEQWNFNRVGQGYGYVRCKNGKVKGGLSTVARLVLGTGQKRVVHYRDGTV